MLCVATALIEILILGFYEKHTSHLLWQGFLKVGFSCVVLIQKIKSTSHFFHWCFSSAKSLRTQCAHCFWDHNYSETILTKSGFTHIWIFKWQCGNCESPNCTGLLVHDSNQNLVWWLIFGLIMVCHEHFPSILERSHPLTHFAVRSIMVLGPYTLLIFQWIPAAVKKPITERISHSVVW